MGARISASRMPQFSCCGAKVVVDAQASCRHPAGAVTLIVMVLSLSMRRRLCCHHDGVVALIAMASLPSPMHRRLAIVNNNDDGAMGNVDDNVNNDGTMATGDNNNDNREGATDDKVDDNDVNSAMNDDIDDNCDGAKDDNNNDDNNAMDNNVKDNGNRATDDDVDDGVGDRTTDGNHTTDNDVDNDGYVPADDDIDNNCGGVTDGHHHLDACSGCAMKGDARRRHTATSNAATSRRTGGEVPADKRRQGLNRPRLRVERWRQSQEDERRRHWFTNEEWESLVALKEADTANRSNTLVADVMDNNTGVLGMENKTIDGESGEV